MRYSEKQLNIKAESLRRQFANGILASYKAEVLEGMGQAGAFIDGWTWEPGQHVTVEPEKQYGVATIIHDLYMAGRMRAE